MYNFIKQYYARFRSAGNIGVINEGDPEWKHDTVEWRMNAHKALREEYRRTKDPSFAFITEYDDKTTRKAFQWMAEYNKASKEDKDIMRAKLKDECKENYDLVRLRDPKKRTQLEHRIFYFFFAEGCKCRVEGRIHKIDQSDFDREACAAVANHQLVDNAQYVRMVKKMARALDKDFRIIKPDTGFLAED